MGIAVDLATVAAAVSLVLTVVIVAGFSRRRR